MLILIYSVVAGIGFKCNSSYFERVMHVCMCVKMISLTKLNVPFELQVGFKLECTILQIMALAKLKPIFNKGDENY